mgnify:CR=1 FL=1
MDCKKHEVTNNIYIPRDLNNISSKYSVSADRYDLFALATASFAISLTSLGLFQPSATLRGYRVKLLILISSTDLLPKPLKHKSDYMTKIALASIDTSLCVLR